MAALEPKRIARVLVVCALPFMLAYALIQPPLSGHDEGAHMARLFELSRGVWQSPRDAEGRYQELPSDLPFWSEQAAKLLLDPDARVDRALLQGAPEEGKASDELVRVPATHVVASPFAYANELPLVWLARVFGLSPLYQMYLARVAGLATFIALAAFAVCASGELAWSFAVLALTPMALNAAATASLAGLTNGLALVFLALLLRAVRAAWGDGSDARAEARARRTLALLLALLTLCKPAFALLTLSLLALPARAAPRSFARFAPAGLALGLAQLALGLSVALDSTFFEPFGGGGFWDRFSFPLLQPVSAFRIFRKTLFRQADEVWLQMFGAHDLLSEQLRFLSSAIAACEACLLLSLTWGALRRLLSLEARCALARWLGLAITLCALALVHSVYFSANERVPESIAQLDGGDFFPLLAALCVVLATRGHAFATRFLHKRPWRRVLAPMLALNVWFLLSLIARFWWPAVVEFPY